MQSAKTIFIADDDRNLVEALSARCEDLGFNVRTAFDGLEVAVSVVSEPPDVLLLDVNMPGADGLSVAEKITEYQSFDPYPIIFLTGRSDELPKKTARDLNAHYLRKDTQTWEKLRPLLLELMGVQYGKFHNLNTRSAARKVQSSGNVVTFQKREA